MEFRCSYMLVQKKDLYKGAVSNKLNNDLQPQKENEIDIP